MVKYPKIGLNDFKFLKSKTLLTGYSKLFFFLYFSCALHTIAWGQPNRLPYTFVEIFKIDGESLDNKIHCFLEDSKGYLWIGTGAGLKLYNTSVSFKHDAQNPHSLVNNIVNTICEDNQGRLWVGTAEGLCFYDFKKNHFQTIKSLSHIDNNVQNITCDYQGNIWFTISQKGLFMINPNTYEIKNFQHKPKNPQTIDSNLPLAKGLYEDPLHKGLWISTEGGLNFFDFKTQIFYNKNHNPEKLPIFIDGISGITIHKNKLVFGVAATEQILFYDFTKKQIVKTISAHLPSGSPIFKIHKIFFDAQENIWLGSYNEVSAIILAKTDQIIELKHDPNTPSSLSDYNFEDIIQQKNGLIWVGTLSGLNVIDPNNRYFEYHNIIDSEKPNTANYLNDFVEDKTDGSWWFTDVSANLIHYLPTTLERYQYRLNLIKANLFFISIQDFGQNLIACTQKEAYFFNKKNKTFSKINIPFDFNKEPNLKITKCLLQGKKLWLFFGGNGFNKAFCYNIVSKTWETYPIQIQTNSKSPNFGVSGCMLSKKGEIWLTIDGQGLAKFSSRKKAFELIKTKQKINFEKVKFADIVEDSKGIIWLSTYDLIRFDPNTNDFSTAANTDYAGALAVDKLGNVWTCYDSQMLIYMPSIKQSYAGYIDIFPHEEKTAWLNRLIKLSNEKMVGFVKERVVIIDSDLLQQSTRKDNLLVNKIQGADTAIFIHGNDTKINLAADKNTFSIHYDVVCSPGTKRYEYFYQLEGFDNDWKSNISSYQIYSQLKGGDYVFKVKALNVKGEYLPTQKVYIHIGTHFYMSNWFYALVASSIMMAAYSFYRYRLSEQSKYFKLREKAENLEKEKTIVQYESLKQHLNPHFLFNSLTSLRSLIKTNASAAVGFLDGMSKVYRYVLKSGEQELTTLEAELAFVKTYIELQKTRFGHGLEVTFNVEQNMQDKYIAPVTLQNLIENAIKHNTADAESPLKINIFTENNYIIVKNNLQRYRIVESSNNRGLSNMKSLYKFYTETAIEINDGNGFFEIKIPLL